MRKRTTNNQQGFALIDVMIAALVLATGVIAFVKLENNGFRTAQNVNYRLQATAAAQSTIEILRNDRGLARWLANTANTNSSNKIISGQSTAQKCKLGEISESGNPVAVSDESTWCSASGDLIRADMQEKIKKVLYENFDSVNGKAVICILPISDNGAGGTVNYSQPFTVRITTIWKIATNNGFVKAEEGLCPGINDKMNIKRGFNTQSDIGYYDVYTKI